MPNTDASISYEGEHEYSYIDSEDVRILTRNPIVYQDETSLSSHFKQHCYLSDNSLIFMITYIECVLKLWSVKPHW